MKLHNAEQTKPIYQYKNTKIKLYKNNAAIWYNKTCRARQITPTYANIKMKVQSALNQCTVQTFTESEDTRCCVNTIFPPEDRHVDARNMSRIIM
jgi:sucrose-6-phosphate hydrolase SacC (GH32 family)